MSTGFGPLLKMLMMLGQNAKQDTRVLNSLYTTDFQHIGHSEKRIGRCFK